MNDTTRQISRRQLLAGAGLGTAGAVLGAVSLSTSAAQAQDKWDYTTDIVAVGGGSAGLTAACAAVSEGDNVIVLEKGPVIGGTTAKSGGVFWIPNHFALRENGVDDAKADCMRYLCRFSYPERYTPTSPTLGLEEPEYALLEAFYDNGAAGVDRMREIGALSSMQWRIWGADKLAPDYFDHAPENKVPYGRPLGPQAADGSLGRGTDMIEQLAAYVTGRGSRILTDHRAMRLVLNDPGEVVGLEAETEGRTITVRARKAVVFGSGGYAHNPAFIRRYQRNHSFGSCATGLATGDFIEIAGAAGAQFGNLSGAWRAQVLVEECLKNPRLPACVFYPPGDSMIQVNRVGRRVVNEKRNYNDRTEIHFGYNPTDEDFSNRLLFMIFDQRTREAFAGAYPLPPPARQSPFMIEGKTFAELARNIEARLAQLASHTGNFSLDAEFSEHLETTVKQFNDYARSGQDPDHHRGAQRYDREWAGLFSPMHPDTTRPENDLTNPTMHPFEADGPYFAFILGAGVLDTNGGPVINEKAQVLGASGQPIPGLYGAGNCIANPSREAYYGAGGTIGVAFTFGYIAGVNAHREPVKAI